MSEVKAKLRCPFCGCDDLCYTYGTKDREGTPTAVSCVTCGAVGPWYYEASGERGQADKAWDERFDFDGHDPADSVVVSREDLRVAVGELRQMKNIYPDVYGRLAALVKE